jgi:hypothetical protein
MRTVKPRKLQLHRETLRPLDDRPATEPVNVLTSRCHSGALCCNEG